MIRLEQNESKEDLNSPGRSGSVDIDGHRFHFESVIVLSDFVKGRSFKGRCQIRLCWEKSGDMELFSFPLELTGLGFEYSIRQALNEARTGLAEAAKVEGFIIQRAKVH